MVNKSKTVYLCSACGQDFPKWNGQCPSCQEWGTLSEYKVSKKQKTNLSGKKKDTHLLEDILHKDEAQRISTGIEEVDRVLGGGVLSGSMILLGGSPGIGKSTLALQILSPFNQNVLYASAEESEDQIALRAKRLKVLSSNIHLSSENRIDEILNHVTLLKPELLIIDSIQTIFSENIDPLPGSVSQIRECGQKLLQLAKDEKIAILVIGHVTKEGVIAGPKMLEHMVDTVLYLEGDERHDHRILRSVKNRFGTTNEVGIFQMTTDGLDEVKNPSELFLAERRIDITGSTIFPSLEGTRPILVEIQSLVSTANFSAPQRNVNGFDFKRLSMLLAVLEKRMGYKMGMKDVFVNLVGGLKINDPAADLSVISALASSDKDQLIKDSVILIGEVGLGGEIRSVTRLEDRLNESIALGFTEVVAPKTSVNRLKQKPKGIKLHSVSHVVEAFNIIFK
ncbi:MAG: DNA repair protein RadA [Candidatus Neomarinimicrobiota bacterium]|jgi:DNA repair protein RadA/Sms|nr:DNA repair protein RadA [Candidatus Neomarinimicrobiota bacterium]MEC7871533.1 DNA repair protein RadA [Candidatus Neomarinimicrobiota bacterium]MEC9006781.1 DNA repair protein RadA [Candidatus Neomarinimicrobiota bacterium]MEC9436861.1 DNA repair protein RadA [Candidatus Neomarinimicrobiota bacterium]MEC9474611.1 DNA repair protein RadA [Candidatus Neomarinimicrobiota bacterium]|tara:strand:- start:2361 stop:3716 length:1356 start_codon:yes stop_codon:yes gene_type:complete